MGGMAGMLSLSNDMWKTSREEVSDLEVLILNARLFALNPDLYSGGATE